jgi:murein peptide amidase A
MRLFHPRSLAPLLLGSAVVMLRADTDATSRTATLIGQSHLGRTLQGLRIGGGPLRILVIGGIHGDEREGGAAMPELLAWLEQSSGETGVATWMVIPDLNPDGASADRRTNHRGVDLNRNWPAQNFAPAPSRGAEPLSEPETRAAHELFLSFAPHLVIALHSAENGPFVNFDGPAAELASAFAASARALDSSWRVVAAMGYPTPGSLGSFAGVDRAIPVLTIEFRRGAGNPWPSLQAGLRGALARIL